MCERTRKKLNSIKTINGLMTSGTKEALDVMLDELESMTAMVDGVKQDVADISSRMTVVEQGMSEVLRLANALNNKLAVDKIEEKAAQMDFLQRIAGSKIGKIVIIGTVVALLGSGVGLVYLIDHYKEVSEIVDTVKR